MNLTEQTSKKKFGNKSIPSKFQRKSSTLPRSTSFFKSTSSTINDFEKRKLAEQRATRRLKGDSTYKDFKGKVGSKKRELKLTVSRALSDKIETKTRSMAALKRAKLKENRDLTKEEIQESLKPIKRDINIPEAITVRELANRMAEQSSNVIKHLLEICLLYTSPSPRDGLLSRMPSSA